MPASVVSLKIGHAVFGMVEADPALGSATAKRCDSRASAAVEVKYTHPYDMGVKMTTRIRA